MISRFVYDPAERDLWVEFTTGRKYVYSGVPEEVANALRSAFAKGAYFNSRIRDRFPHREVTHEEESNS
ncbi:MAG TPA: KTSC domain-containing protein [Sphingomicrobium sp.]|nr:KTSC domain-containing protein [Sphingomicrobium sp.]